MKILVTGANGLLGQKLTALLSEQPDVTLIATAREGIRNPLKRGSFQPLDVTNEDQVNQAVASILPQVIIHTAAMTQVDQCETERDLCWLNNVTAVGYLAKASDKHSVHLIHLSTDFIFDGTFGPLEETAVPNPLSHYGRSKLASEEIVQKMASPWTILRTVLVYGVVPDLSRSNIVLWVKKSLEDGKTIKVVNDQWRTPTLAEDLATGCWLAASRKATGIFNISGDEMMTPHDIALRTAEYFGLNKDLIKETNSSEFKQPAARPPKTGFIIKKAQRELGYQPHTFKEGLSILASQLH